MKTTKGKKLSLTKLRISKLHQMSSIKGGYTDKSGRPGCAGSPIFVLTLTCETKCDCTPTNTCPTILQG